MVVRWLVLVMTMLVFGLGVHADPIAVVQLETQQGEYGVALAWADSAAAKTYRILRIDSTGETMELRLRGDVYAFLDPSASTGTYTYVIFADRGDHEDASNPAAVSDWPYCLPSFHVGPPFVSWSASCYCPMPAPLPPNPEFLCS